MSRFICSLTCLISILLCCTFARKSLPSTHILDRLERSSSSSFVYSPECKSLRVASSSSSKKGNSSDWEDERVRVVGGVVAGKTYEAERLMWVAQPLGCEIDVEFQDFMDNQAHVQRVMKVLNKKRWAKLFPNADDFYLYENFLRALANFPFFCGERGAASSSNFTLDQLCKKELSTLFAHWTYQTSSNSSSFTSRWQLGLSKKVEEGCSSHPLNSHCLLYSSESEFFPAAEGRDYFGRGPFSLRGNDAYGQASLAITGSEGVLLRRPQLVAKDPIVAFQTALWVYMRPQAPQPSAHDVVVGRWTPTGEELGRGFGTTVRVLWGKEGCESGAERVQIYKEFMNYFHLEVDEEDIVCDSKKDFSTEGAGVVDMYWDKSETENQCKLVSYQTPFSLVVHSDYQRCLSHFF